MQHQLGLKTVTFSATRRVEDAGGEQVRSELSDLTTARGADEFPVVKDESRDRGVIWFGGDDRIGYGRGIIAEYDDGVVNVHTTFGGTQKSMFAPVLDEIVRVFDYFVVGDLTAELELTKACTELDGMPTEYSGRAVHGVTFADDEYEYRFENAGGETQIRAERVEEVSVRSVSGFLEAEVEQYRDFVVEFIPGGEQETLGPNPVE